MRAARSQDENFLWCTSGCGSGQIFTGDRDHPTMKCLHCGHKSCFYHQSSWHEHITCAQYDQLLEDPDNFQLPPDCVNETDTTEQQKDARQVIIQDALQAKDKGVERKLKAEKEKQHARRAAELARQVVARRKQEDDKSMLVVKKTSKPCPGCGWAIEKDDGWYVPT